MKKKRVHVFEDTRGFKCIKFSDAKINSGQDET